MKSPALPLAGTTGVLLLIGLLGAGTARAQSFSYNGFSSTAGLQLNGGAAAVAGFVPSDGTVLRLTPAAGYQAGSAFSTTLISLNSTASFSTAFNFRISQSGGWSDMDGVGADGIVFVVQPIANNVGGAGGGIGYLGIPQSLGVEFDTWYNGSGFGDPNGNHVAIDVNGSFTSDPVAPVATRMNDGQLWWAWVDYNGASNDLQVRLSQTSIRPATPLLQTSAINLQSVLGQSNAYVGFTAGTGAAWGNHDIVSWQFNNTYQPIMHGVADSTATAALLSLSLVGIATLVRRRRSA